MKFTYYTIIGKDLELLKGHVENVKEYAGFDKLTCDKEFLIIVYKNKNIPTNVTDVLLEYCANNGIRTVLYDEPTDSFLDNLYRSWNLGYEHATDGYVFRAGSDQVFSKDSFPKLYEAALKLRVGFGDTKIILQANTIENKTRIISTGAGSRHFCEDFGFTFQSFDYAAFENFIASINKGVPEIVDIATALGHWGHPTPLPTSLGMVNRVDGCSWLMTKEDFNKYGPLPPLENNVTGDVIIHDRFQKAGYQSYIVRDCITYHFVRWERMC